MLLTTRFVYAFCSLVISAVAHWVYQRFLSRRGIPDSIPWAGVNEGRFVWLSRARATLRSLFDTRSLLEEGYERYSKKNIPYVLPNILTGPEVILPQSALKWLEKFGEDVLDQNEINRDFLQADYTMLHPKVVFDGIHENVIKSQLTQRLGDFTEDVTEEVDYAFKRSWGTNTDNWTEVTVYDSMSEIISRVSNRILVGLPLCRDEDYLYHSSRFNRWVVPMSAAISLCPAFLKWLIAPIVTLHDRKLYWNMTKHITPIWKLQSSKRFQGKSKENNYVQWAINEAENNAERGLDMISKRLAALSFAAIQSSVITSANLLFDLAASPRTPFFMKTIRDDVNTQLQTTGGKWTKSVLSRMLTLDSTLRESMRMWGFVSRGVLKQVVAKEGVTLEDRHTHLPYGAKVGIQAFSVHHDKDLYPNPWEFDALRFCAPPNNNGFSEFHPESMQERVLGIPLTMASANLMVFSHGKNACPGRFFASQQLKLVLAYIALNYDIKPIANRPVNNWFVGSQGPPLGDKISIRRRERTV